MKLARWSPVVQRIASKLADKSRCAESICMTAKSIAPEIDFTGFIWSCLRLNPFVSGFAQIVDRALFAKRFTGLAGVTSMQNEPMMSINDVFLGNNFH
jgi:hypothetical protein